MNPSIDVLGIGLNATDTVVLVDDFPANGGKAPFTEEFVSPGGQVATAMVACARLGLKAAYIGSVGDDERGRIQIQSLVGTGVDTSGVVVVKDCQNQSAYIVVDRRSGERTVLWRRAPELALTADQIDPSRILAARMLHIDGCDVDACAFAARVARENGIGVSLDVDTVYPNFESVLPYVDFLIASENWVAAWTGETSPVRALERIAREYRSRVVGMTCGRWGAIAIEADKLVYSPGFQVACSDTTGAGDAFHGAFCYSMLKNFDLQSAFDFSNAAAALNCTAFGARGHLPALREVEALLSSGTQRSINQEFVR